MKDTRSLEQWAAEETAAERAEQGLPETVEDPVALDHVATILASAARPAPSSSGTGRTGAAGSTRKRTGTSGSAPVHAARAGQPSGSSAPARSTSKQKAAVVAPTTASQTAAGG